MGHLLGLDHDHHGLMDDELAAGVRRNPDAEAIALALAADPAAVRRRARMEDLFSDQDALDEVLTLF